MNIRVCLCVLFLCRRVQTDALRRNASSSEVAQQMATKHSGNQRQGLFGLQSHKIEIDMPHSEHNRHITHRGCERNIRHKEENRLRAPSGCQANLRNLISENRPRESL